MNNLDHSLVPIVLFICTVIIVIALLNFILKMRVLYTNIKDEQFVKLITKSFEYKSSALQWGLILLFGGAGLIIIEYVPNAQNMESPLPYGLEAVFVAAGLILYHVLSKKSRQ